MLVLGGHKWTAFETSMRVEAPARVLACCTEPAIEQAQTQSALLGVKASICFSEIADAPTDHFRVGLGRLGLEPGLEAFERFLRQR